MIYYLMVVAASTIIFTTWLAVSNPHKNDEALRAKCEAAGGTFVHANEPRHLCVTEVIKL